MNLVSSWNLEFYLLEGKQLSGDLAWSGRGNGERLMEGAAIRMAAALVTWPLLSRANSARPVYSGLEPADGPPTNRCAFRCWYQDALDWRKRTKGGRGSFPFCPLELSCLAVAIRIRLPGAQAASTGSQA